MVMKLEKYYKLTNNHRTGTIMMNDILKNKLAINSDDLFDKAMMEDNNKLAKIIKDNNLTEDEVINMIKWHLNK